MTDQNDLAMIRGLAVPNGCRWCGVDRQRHCQRWHEDARAARLDRTHERATPTADARTADREDEIVMRDPNPLDESTQRLLDDFFHYPDQPRCPVCGRFARRRSPEGWELDCLNWFGTGELWVHDLMGKL